MYLFDATESYSTGVSQKYDRLELVYPIINYEPSAIADKEPIPEQIWQHYKESGDEIIPIPEARFVPLASVSLKDVS